MQAGTSPIILQSAMEFIVLLSTIAFLTLLAIRGQGPLAVKRLAQTNSAVKLDATTEKEESRYITAS